MPSLTVSGNEITDASRALNVQGDGRSADSSFGVWEATTNRFRFGKAKANTDSFAFGAAVRTQDATVAGPFVDHQSLKVVTTAAANDGIGIQSAAGRAAAPGAPTIGSVWVKGTPGVVLYSRSRWTNTDASVTDSGQTFLTLDGTWQELESASIAVAAGKTGDVAQLMIRQRDAVATTFWISAGQIEDQLLCTPYVMTDAGATATRAAARVQAPASLLDETQGWVAMRVRMGWGTGTSGTPLTDPTFFHWADTANAEMRLYQDDGTNNWIVTRRSAGASMTAQVTLAKTAGATVTLVYAWTATQVKISVDGSVFATGANTTIPTLAANTFEIGAALAAVFGARESDSDFLWFACGTGTLTDADAASIHAFSNNDKAPEDFIAIAPASACTATWAADTPDYIDDTFTILDPGPTGASRGISPRLKVEIDFTNNPTTGTRVYTDVTTDVRQLSYQSDGRNHELSRTDVGTLNAVLNNRHGYYDPTNVASPRYPGVKRKRWIRVSARWNNVTYRRWTGLIEEWSQQWPAFGKDATVAISASSALSVLNLFDLDALSYGAQATGTRTGAVLTSAGVTGYTVDTGASTVVASGTFARGSIALAHLLDVEETENGRLFSKGDGTVTFQSRHFRLLSSAASQGTIGDLAGEIRYRTGQLDLDDADLYSEVEVTPSGGTPETATDAASKLAHYTRRLNRDILSSSQTEALSNAQYLLSLYADPTSRIPSVELVGAADTAKWPTILAAKISDRFVWKRRAAVNTITEDVFVERYSDAVVPGRDWRVALQLSPADDQSGWVLGDATYGLLGESTVLIY